MKPKALSLLLFIGLGATSPTFASSCDLRYFQIAKATVAGRTVVTVQVYSSCYLESYPFLALRRKSDNAIIAQGDLISFGQPANTLDEYSVAIPDSVPFDLSTSALIMVSSVGKVEHEIVADTPTSSNLLRLVSSKQGNDPDHMLIKFDKSLRLVRVRTFCGNDMNLEFSMRNTIEFVDEVVVPLPVCNSASMNIWVEGYAGQGAEGWRRYFGRLPSN